MAQAKAVEALLPVVTTAADDIRKAVTQYIGSNPGDGWHLLKQNGDSLDFPTWIGSTTVTIFSGYPNGDHWAKVRIRPHVLGFGLAAEELSVGGSQQNNRVDASVTRNWVGAKITITNIRANDGDMVFPVYVKTS